MLTDENLRCQNCELGRPALGKKHDIEQSIREAGFRRDWDSASHVSSIGDNHIVKIKLESFGVIQCHPCGVTTQLGKRSRSAALIGQRSPRPLHFRCEVLVNYADESA